MRGCKLYRHRECCSSAHQYDRGGPPTFHVRGRQKLHWACAPCLALTFGTDAVHPLTHACRHPDSAWRDDGCDIPTVAVTIEQVGAVTA